MDKDKQIQKVPGFSLDKIKAKSRLATRGLKDLGLLKDKKHFTIIYTCQFCGRLINYALTPCIFCGNYPKDKKEVVWSQALSSISLEVTELMIISRAIKNKEELVNIIIDLWEKTEDVLKQERHPFFNSLFEFSEMLNCERNQVMEKANRLLQKSKIFCKDCGHEIYFAGILCLYCGVLAKRQGRNPKTLINKLTPLENWIVAVNNILLFIENNLDMGDDEESIDELIFVLIYIINRLIEEDEIPNSELQNYMKKLFNKAHYFGSYELGCAIEIKNNETATEIEEDKNKYKNRSIIMALGANIDYLLKYS